MHPWTLRTGPRISNRYSSNPGTWRDPRVSGITFRYQEDDIDRGMLVPDVQTADHHRRVLAQPFEILGWGQIALQPVPRTRDNDRESGVCPGEKLSNAPTGAWQVWTRNQYGRARTQAELVFVAYASMDNRHGLGSATLG